MRFSPVLLILAVMTPVLLQGQSNGYRGAFAEMFFGRQPSARSEAMGRTQVAVGGVLFSSYYNPAALASLTHLTAGTGLASPYYIEGSRYDYYGAALPLGRLGTVALSRFFFDRALEPAQYDDAIVEQRDYTALYSMNYALRIGHWVDAGVTVHFFRRLTSTPDFEWDMRGWPVDIGLFRSMPINETASLRLGASLSNLNGVKVGIENQRDALPQILRLGGSYVTQIREHGNEPLMRLLATVEYQALLNSDYRRALRVGLEALLWEVLALRVGGYRESLDDHGIARNPDALTEFTYGAGLVIPLKAWMPELPDWVIRLDYTHLPQPDYTGGAANWERFTALGVSVEIR